MKKSNTTIDDFLGGAVRLKQTEYRATSDAVLLASAVPAKEGQTVLDVGCGSGAVVLCLMARVKGLNAFGVDNQEQMVCAAKENALLNKQSVVVEKMDITNPPSKWKEMQFDHVFSNPPYFTETPTRQNTITANAHKQTTPLAEWLDFCIKKVKTKGTLTVIHRAEAVPEILSVLQNRMGKITLVPLYPKKGVCPKRVIIQATKASKAPFRLHTGFVLHNKDNSRTKWAEDVMRKANALNILGID